jgi:hypothetical protein
MVSLRIRRLGMRYNGSDTTCDSSIGLAIQPRHYDMPRSSLDRLGRHVDRRQQWLARSPSIQRG